MFLVSCYVGPRMDFQLESAVLQWEEGHRTLEDARSDPPAYRALGKAVVAVQDELRKRLGSTFSIGELASLYGDRLDWAEELAMARAGEARLADTSTVIDAAFYLYMREAADFAGGSVTPRP
jgi:hypothetical protein